MRTSSSSSKTSLRRLVPPGRGRGGSSTVRGRAAELGLIVRRAEAGGPMEGRRGGAAALAGDFFVGRLEELTPELPDPNHRVGKALQAGRVGHAEAARPRLVGALRHSLRVNPDHAVVNTAFVNDERSDAR